MSDNDEQTDDKGGDSLTFEDDYDPNVVYKGQLEDFMKVKEVLDRNDRFGHFSADFTRMLDSWRATHRREEYFVNQWRYLKTELSQTTQKLQIAEQKHETDEKKLTKWEQDLTSARRLVDESHAREQLSQELIDSLKSQVTRLSQELDLNKVVGDQEQEAGTLAKNKEMLVKEKERLMAELLVARGKLTKAQKNIKELEERSENLERQLAERGTELEALKNELAKERRFKDKIENDLKTMTDTAASKDREILNQGTQLQNTQTTNLKLEATIKEQKATIDKLNKELVDVVSAQKNTKTELEQQHANVARLTNDLTGKMHEVSMREDQLQRLRLDEQKLRKMKENLQKRVEILDSQKSEMDADKSKLLSTVALMEKEAMELKKQIVSDKKIIEALNRERELVAKAAKKTTAVTVEQQAAIALSEVEKKRLEDEISDLKAQINKLQKDVKTGVADRELVTAELTQSKRKANDLDEVVRLREAHIIEMQKNLHDVEGKMKLHVNLFEQVRNERNKVSKRLVEAEDEITELTHNLKVKCYEVEQLKEDMTAKENMLVKGEFNLQKVTKEKESLRLERQKMSTEFKEIKEKLQMLSQEERRLQKIVDDADDDRNRLARELEQVIKERDSLLSLLKEREDETTKLNGKVSLLEDAMKKGEMQYQQRIDDIRLLKVEIKRLRQEKALITRHMGNAVELRREMFHLEKDYTREKLKCRALEDELSNPLNVHRWRKLEGSDPTMFELISKVQLLQKRLLTANEEAVKRENQLNEAEIKLREFEAAQVKQPRNDFADKIHGLTATIREKSNRIMVLEAELTAFEREAAEYKAALDHRDDEIADVKKKYFALKRREQKIRERENDMDRPKMYLPVIASSTATAPGGKYVGGGFNLAQHKMSI